MRVELQVVLRDPPHAHLLLRSVEMGVVLLDYRLRLLARGHAVYLGFEI